MNVFTTLRCGAAKLISHFRTPRTRFALDSAQRDRARSDQPSARPSFWILHAR